MKSVNWQEAGADAFIEGVMPVIRKASNGGNSSDVLDVYGGALGAWYGSLVADAGPEFADQVAEILFRKTRGISFKEQMN